MYKQTKFRYWSRCMALSCCLLLIGTESIVMAQVNNAEASETDEIKQESITKDKVILSQSLEQWNDGLSVILSKLPEERIHLAVEREAADLGEYQSVFLYDYTKRDLSSSDGVSFYLNNLNSFPIQVKLTIVPDGTDENEAVPEAESAAWLRAAEQENFEVIPYKDEVFTLPGNFSGEFYMPLNMFDSKQSKPLKVVNTIGIAVIIPPDVRSAEFELGNINFLDNSLAEMNQRLAVLEISGEDTLTIPQVGAVMTKFEGSYLTSDSESDQPLEFYLEDSLQGINLLSDGVLEVDASAEVPMKLTLYGLDPVSKTSVRKQINLVAMTATEASYGVPAPEAVEPYTTDSIQTLNGLVRPIQIVFAICLSAYGMLVWNWWGKSRLYSQQIRDQFKQSLPKRKKVI